MNAPFPIRLGLLAGLAVAAVFVARCGEEAPPPAPDTGPALKVIDPSKPTPEQEKALANELHVAHLEHEEEPSKCRDCHRVVGKEKTDPGEQHRCLQCHEDQTVAVHSSVANEAARECMTCHEFYESGVDPWSCAGCHTDAENAPTPKIDLPKAPQIEVHEEEACNSCHVPHGEDGPVKLGECAECHEEQTSQHNAKKLDDPAQCAECHQSHDPAKAAERLCADCHAEDVPRQALFEGHDDCVSCHQTHEPEPVVACRSCHEDTKVSGMRDVPEHRDCTSCHDPHRVTASPEASCVGCHEDTDVGHPPDDHDGACAGCHPSHPFRGRIVFSKSCVVCHDEAQTETSFHAGEECQSCHLPHAFSLADSGDATCSECHLEGAPITHEAREKTVLVKPIEDHAKCGECHLEANHDPKAQIEECSTCHEDQKRTMTQGHEDCGECHLPHEGTVETTCRDCHHEKYESRHVTDGQNCDSCHRPHGPDGPEEPQACAECHDEKLPLLHQHEEHQQCGDCHEFHDRGPQRSRSTCLSACHGDMVDHEPAAVSCVGCHPFEVDVPDWLKVEETQ
jgi:hypothetical protein